MSGPTAPVPAAAAPRPPRALTFAVTGRCNLRCRHCLVQSGPRSRHGHVRAEAALRIIGELSALGGEELWLTGGEPLAHPRWPELLAFAGRQPFRTVGLQTNGELLGEAEVATLRELSRDGLALEVSLDGASAETHDRVRGPGAFGRVLAGLRRLAAAGLGKQVTLAFTEMHHNLDDLPHLLGLVEAFGLRRLRSSTLVPSGRAAEGSIAPPAPAQVEALLLRLHRDARFRARVERHGDVAAFAWWRNRHAASPPCCTAGEHPYLAADGTISPCAMLRAREHAVAGAHERPLAAVLAEGAARWSRLEALRRERPARLLACRGCPGELHCAGGCMGRAHAASGELFSVEDRCALRKAVYGFRAPEAPERCRSLPGERRAFPWRGSC